MAVINVVGTPVTLPTTQPSVTNQPSPLNPANMNPNFVPVQGAVQQQPNQVPVQHPVPQQPAPQPVPQQPAHQPVNVTINQPAPEQPKRP